MILIGILFSLSLIISISYAYYIFHVSKDELAHLKEEDALNQIPYTFIIKKYQIEIIWYFLIFII